MKFYEHVEEIVGSQDRVVCGPQRELTDEQVATFENEIYKRELDDAEKYRLRALTRLTQWALAHQEAGLDAIEHADGVWTVESELGYTNDRHERILGIHPSIVEL